MKIIDEIKKIGFENASVIDVSTIEFEPSLTQYCEMNSCGNYGRCYTCPPYIGEVSELIKKAKKYEKMIVFQKIYKIEDSFDIEGMLKGNDDFRILVRSLAKVAREKINNPLILTAGGCKNCKPCKIIDNLPCVDPENAFLSLEAYAINVSTLAKKANMNYINGVNTTTFFGAILF